MTIRRQEFSNPTGYLYLFTGDTTTEDLKVVGDAVRNNEEVVFVMLDFTNASIVNVTLTDLHQIAILDTTLDKTHQFEKLALVGLSGTERWLAETYVFFTEKWLGKRKEYETKIFDHCDDASKWLNLYCSGEQ